MVTQDPASDEAARAHLVERLAEFYDGLGENEKALLSGVVWRSLPPVERVQFSTTAEAFNDVELRLLEELEQ